ncbi:1-aminocyclopropane-1-carboxylate oxidase -like protein [Capsicum chinense]|nr:1-aminocyclopropane-1-carboxylate oxidase -like protein [Capsicum chinense]
MAVSSTDDIQATVQKNYDRMNDIKAFDDTSDTRETQFLFPVIGLEGIDKDPIKHKEIVDKVRDASETRDFFQVVNHGIPTSVLGEALQGTQFFKQDNEVKKQDTGVHLFVLRSLLLFVVLVP